ncbi:hypothetical protein AMS68_007218 [Peltaster fructicola]|uniref:Gluconokinase n=1 Tax=Peltaster fructicola TaxID=286661 RepID=A0A6H0Y453_9PEZI|nr:hypothetical protein AMS68_007218 [Peltaster fructicola]
MRLRQPHAASDPPNVITKDWSQAQYMILAVQSQAMSTRATNDDSLPTPPSEPTALFHPHTAMTTSNPAPLTTNKYIWVVIGPAGCGKTSVAECLKNNFNMPYLEGDAYHTPENVAKMASGHPLTDADRWDWLIVLREEALKTLQTNHGVVLTCSALKRKYRDVIRVAAYHNPEVRINFIYLNASEAILMDRVKARRGHFMKDSMVHSQFQSLEAPLADETDILSVDANGASSEVQKLAIAVVEKAMK